MAKRDRKKPKHRVRTRPEGTIGYGVGQVNEAINDQRLGMWVIQDAWIRFEHGVLVKDGTVFRVIGNNGTRYRGAKRPTDAITLWQRGELAPRERPKRGDRWVRKSRPNEGLEITSMDGQDGGDYYVVGKLVFYDTARRAWQPIYRNGTGKQRQKGGELSVFLRAYRREYDMERSSA